MNNQAFVDLINQSLTEIDLSEVITVKPQRCENFYELMDIYRKDMTVTDSMVDCMAVGFATHIAVKIDGDPLWLYLVGSPSSGKSTICELLAADEVHSRPISKFTGLVSGSRQGSHLIPMLQNRCVIIKDGTLLLESTPQQLANVYGELRDIFDGSLEAHYRNGVSASFSNISFGMVIGITERIYGLNMSALGERFLHCKLETTRETEQLRNRSAISSIFSASKLTVAEGNDLADKRSFPVQKSFTAGFLSYLHNRVTAEEILRPSYTQEDAELIQAMADVIACSRAQTPRKDGQEEIMYESRPEASTRVVKQLSRLALCLCYVLGKSSIDSEILRLLKKVTLDTAFSRQYSIIRHVAMSQNGLNRQSIAALTEIPLQSILRRIEDLCSLGIFISDSATIRPKQGRSVPVIKCDPWVQKAFLLVENFNATETKTSQTSIPKAPVKIPGYRPPRDQRTKAIPRPRPR